MAALFLTGAPGVGKTTVLRRVLASYRGLPLQGFLTDEIRAGKERVGFRIVSLDGRAERLAHVDLVSPHRVGRYRVDVSAIERMVEATLGKPSFPEAVLVIDEIGKMECLSSERPPRSPTTMRSL
jgi:nucleoside-triphosphatase